MKDCPKCRGEGRFYYADNLASWEETCHACRGSGRDQEAEAIEEEVATLRSEVAELRRELKSLKADFMRKMVTP